MPSQSDDWGAPGDEAAGVAACAIVGDSGGADADAGSVEPKNGRVTTTFALPFNPTDSLCTAPQCGSGQTTKLISWAIPTGGADFKLCTTNQPAGQPHTCDGTTFDTQTCGPTGDIVFAGKKGSCAALF